MRARPLLPALVAALAAGTVACRAPTEFRLIVHSDVPCAGAPRVMLWTGSDLAAARATAPRAFAATCEGRVDDVYVVPDGDARGFVAMLATRVDGGDPTLCNAESPPTGCVVQEWRLSFRAHVAQSFETTLSKSCADVRCDPGSTCVRPGVCVTDTIPEACDEGCQAEKKGLGVASDVYAAGDVTCVRDAAARVTCWGSGSEGSLGRGSLSNAGDLPATTPAAIGPIDFGGGRTVAKLALSRSHACALLDDGTLRCWGRNVEGQLGYGDTNRRGDTPLNAPAQLAPVPLPAGRRVRDLAVGVGTTCVVLDDGSLRCWGGNTPAELGYGDGVRRGDTSSTTPDRLGPVPLGAGHTVSQLSVGYGHVCIVRDDAALLCWGNNFFGELGLGDTNPRGGDPGSTPDQLTPIALPGGRTAARVYAGQSVTCAMTTSHELLCWGMGGNGLTARGDASSLGDKPENVPAKLAPIDLGGARATAFWLGDASACAGFATGGVRCWGSNFAGALGYGDESPRGLSLDTIPGRLPEVPIPAGRTVRSMSLGFQHSCAIFDDGTVRCWGSGEFGQLGYGDVTSRGGAPESTPQALPPIALPK